MSKDSIIQGPRHRGYQEAEGEALLKLLVPNQTGTKGLPVGNGKVEHPDLHRMRNLSEDTAADIRNAESVQEMLPDIKLAKMIWVSSIISPQDMVSSDVDFSLINPNIPAEIIAASKERLDYHFKNHYIISEFLPEAIGDALIDRGSYPLMVVPETALDSIINNGGRVTLEQFADQFNFEKQLPTNTGILGPGYYSELSGGNLVERESAKVVEVFSQEDFSLEPQPAPSLNSTLDSELACKKIFVTDNFNVLKFSALRAKLSEDKMNTAIDAMAINTSRSKAAQRKLSREHYTGMPAERKVQLNVIQNQNQPQLSVAQAAEQKLSPTEVLDRNLNRARPSAGSQSMSLAPVESYSRRPVGHPLVMKLPSECLIPIYVPGSPRDHVGYFLLLDRQGNPLDLSRELTGAKDLANRLSNTKDANNTVVDNSMRQMMGWNTSGVDDLEFDAMWASFGTVVEQDVRSRLNSGVFRGGVDLRIDDAIKRVCLSRRLANEATQMLFIPISLVTYFAFDHNERGIGRSLLDETKIISSIRSVLMFSNTMANIRKAVGQTTLKFELDPEDLEPELTVETGIHEYGRTRMRRFPIGAQGPADIISFLQDSATNVVVSGNKRYPETTMSTEDRSVAGVEADTQLEDSYRRQHIQGLGLSPELFDGGTTVNFAESVVSGNLLMAKRVAIYQKVTIDAISDHCRKYIHADGTLYQGIWDDTAEVLAEFDQKQIASLLEYHEIDLAEFNLTKEDFEADEKGEEKTNKRHVVDELIACLVNDIIESYKLQLPTPDVTKFEQQVKAFTMYKTALLEALPAYISREMIESIVTSQEGATVEGVYNSIIGYFLRDWMSRNNMMPELRALSDLEGRGGADIIEAVSTQLKDTQQVLQKVFEQTAKSSKKFEDKMEKLNAGSETPEGTDFEPGTGEEDGPKYGDLSAGLGSNSVAQELDPENEQFE